MEKEKRTESLHIRIKPSTKKAAEDAAEKHGRTLSNYIEWLIIQETKKGGK